MVLRNGRRAVGHALTGRMPDGATRLVSLHDPDARPIARDASAEAASGTNVGPAAPLVAARGCCRRADQPGSGSRRYVLDYLAEEVLERQPEHVRTFPLETSVLGRLSGELWDAVTGSTGGQALLEALERATCS